MSDRARAALGAAVQDEARAMAYGFCYPCTVLKDWGDMTLDLQPDDSELLPALEKISLRLGLPGVRIKLKAGARVWLAFDNAEADKPLCYLFETGQIEKFEMTTGLGQTINVDDDRGQTSDDGEYARPSITVKDKAGNMLKLDATPGAEKVTLSHVAGHLIEMTKAGMTVNSPLPMAITSAAPITVTTPMLTYNGREVARKGDPVTSGGIITP